MNLIGPKDSNMAEKNLYNALHASLVRDTRQQSDRDFPRMSIRGGFGDGTKMAAHEAMIVPMYPDAAICWGILAGGGGSRALF